MFMPAITYRCPFLPHSITMSTMMTRWLSSIISENTILILRYKSKSNRSSQLTLRSTIAQERLAIITSVSFSKISAMRCIVICLWVSPSRKRLLWVPPSDGYQKLNLIWNSRKKRKLSLPACTMITCDGTPSWSLFLPFIVRHWNLQKSLLFLLKQFVIVILAVEVLISIGVLLYILNAVQAIGFFQQVTNITRNKSGKQPEYMFFAEVLL